MTQITLKITIKICFLSVSSIIEYYWSSFKSLVGSILPHSKNVRSWQRLFGNKIVDIQAGIAKHWK